MAVVVSGPHRERETERERDIERHREKERDIERHRETEIERET